MANRINKKYFLFAWIALIFACFVENVFDIYQVALSLKGSGSVQILLFILEILAFDGVVPTVIVWVCTLIVWRIGFSRYVRFMSVKDFSTLAMFSVAAVKLLTGIIDAFAILNGNVAIVTDTVLYPLLLTGALFAMYFLVLAPRYSLNPVEKFNSFKVWFTVYFAVYGLLTVFGNAFTIALCDGSADSMDIVQLLNSMGYVVNTTSVQKGSSIAALIIYFLYLIAFIVVIEVYRKKVKIYRNGNANADYTVKPEPEVQETADKKNDSVFDEFDI